MRFGPFVWALILAVSVGHAEENLFQPSVRSPRLGDVIYFLLPDRFEDGDPTNNTGHSPSSDPNENGFDPSNPNFFHGGDLKGITGIKGDTNYKFLGTADSPPYRIFPTWDEVPQAPDLEFEAVARDLSGRETTAECAWHRPAPGHRGEEGGHRGEN
jgi:hypothetical protein